MKALIPVSWFSEPPVELFGATQKWSAVVEMTAATEEYFLEVRRLQRLLAQLQQSTSANSPVGGVSDRGGGAAREAYIPNQRDPPQHRNSGVDDTVWIHRPEACDVSMSVPSPVDGVQENRRILDAEIAFTSGGGDVFNVLHRPTSASAAQANEFHVAHREDNDMFLHESGVPASRRRPASPKRRASPPRRARMATRAGRETFGDGTCKKRSEEPRGLRQTPQVTRGVLRRKQRGGSQSLAWIRATDARASARGVDARRSAVGTRSRPLSAPRTKRELNLTTMGDARGADSLSPFDKGRRQVASSDRGASPRSGGGGRAAGARQKITPRLSSSSSHAPADRRRISTVPVTTEPGTWGTGQKGRPKPRSRSASPRSSSSGKRTVAGDAFRAQGEGRARTTSASVTKHQTIGRNDENDGGSSCGDGGSDAGLTGVAAAPQSSQRVEGELESPSLRDDDGTSDDVHYDDPKRRLSSSVPSRESLEAAASAEHPSATVAKECEEGTTPTTQGREGEKEQTADYASSLDPAGRGDAESASKDKESRVAEGDELAHNLPKSSPSSWGSFDVDGEPPNNGAEEENSQEETARPVLSQTSFDADARETPNVDVRMLEKSITSTSNIKTEEGGEQQVTVGEKTSGSNGSPNESDNNRSSPRSEVGDDNTVTRSVSSHAVTEKAHQGEVVDVELETDNLLFDIGGDGDSDGDDPLAGEDGPAPSEYGDDFDDFEDED